MAAWPGPVAPIIDVAARSFMPHLGQRPGWSLTTSGCIGQAYVVAAAGAAAVASSFIPHLGQRPALSLTTSGCIGQAYMVAPVGAALGSCISATSARILS